MTFSKRVKIKRVINKDNIDSRFTHFTPTRDSDKDTHSLALSASKLCPLSFPGNTALTQQFQFLIWSGLETFSCQAVDAGLVKTEELSGNLRGQTRYSILSESDLPSTAKKRVSRGSEATEVRIES